MGTRAVLYAYDMEPITVLELDEITMAYLEKREMVSIVAWPEITPESVYCDPKEPIKPPYLREVTICAEFFYRRGERHMFLFTQDEDSALILRSVFLPGQRSNLRKVEQAAMAKGFMKALSLIVSMNRGDEDG